MYVVASSWRCAPDPNPQTLNSQEMYSEYMEMRSERVQLEKQVRDMATSRSILSRKAAAADAIARRLRDNINMDVGL